jgi:formylglycine-generating enzyme required for sulfatase activity
MELDCGGGVTMKLAYIPAGEFLMGSPDNEPGRGPGEGPQHRVRITKGFYIAVTHVTQAQYEAVMGNNPSTYKGRENPVETMLWNDAVEFCKRLSARTGREVRLPTEAEWEYACRAGTTTRYFFGDADGELSEYAWWKANTGNTPKPVGQKRPNPWGLYDMGGNVWQFCQDWYADKYYGESPLVDPPGPAVGQLMGPAVPPIPARVVRGAAWNNAPTPGECRSATRDATDPNGAPNVGFRVVCNEAVPGAAAPAKPTAGLSPGKTVEMDCGGVPMKLTYIPPGDFLMGSPENEAGRYGPEGPQHRVRITKAFYMGVTEVTQAQYEAIMGKNPSTHRRQENPVETVLWSDAVEFCKRLSTRTGREVRLPTEAEWEYACRAGTTTRYFFGDAEGDLGDYAWYQGNNSPGTNTPKPVGRRLPNPWGLYDIYGNVLEWCQDWYDERYYGKSPVSDPTGPMVGQLFGPSAPPAPARAVRGSFWNNDARELRSAWRGGSYAHVPVGNVGFRVVCAAE